MRKINLQSPIYNRQQNNALQTGNAKTNNLRHTLRWMALVLVLLGGAVRAQINNPMTTDCRIVADNVTTGVDDIASNSNICVGTTIDFSKIYCSGLTINALVNWTIVSDAGVSITTTGNMAMSAIFTYTFNNPGTYIINYQSTTGAQIPDYAFKINVVTTPSASNISFAPSGIFCGGGDVTFNASTTSFFGTAFTGTIDYGDGIIENLGLASFGAWVNLFTQFPKTHTYPAYNASQNNTYTATLTIQNACGTVSVNNTITIMPSLPVTISSATVCNGSSSSVTLNANPSNLPTSNYIWKKQTQTGWVTVQTGGSSLIVSGPFTSNQTYSCTVTNANGCTGTGVGNITIAQDPFGIINGSTTQCAGNAQTYSLAGYSSGLTSGVIWTINPPSAGNITNPTGSGGTRTITWTNIPPTGATITTNYTFGNGCSGSRTLTVMPCCNMPASNLWQSFNNTTISTPVTFTGNGTQIITIDGNVTINANVTFDNVQVKLGDNAQIKVNPNCTFTIKNNTTFSARCNKMWDGILVLGNTSKVKMFNNCTLQDAKRAISSYNGGLFEIDGNCTFNKNFRHIVVQDYSNAQHTLQHNGYVCESTIFNCQHLTWSLPGNDFLIYPYAGKKTFVAIDIINVDNINIGNPAINGKNHFENCNIAINVQKSSAVIKNNEILKTRTDNADNYKCPCNVGTAICAKGNTNEANILRKLVVGASGNTNEANEIHNVKYGIDVTQNISVDIQGNSIYNIPFIGIKVADHTIINELGHIVSGNTMYNIENTFIKFVNNNVCSKEISNNNFNQGISSTLVTPTTFLATAIDVSEPNNTPSTDLEKCYISGNYINAVQRGIYCNLVAKLRIVKNNKIYLNTKPETSPDHDGYGIRLSACKDNEVTNNTVVAASHWNYHVNGIWISDCINNKIQCNALGHLGYGLRFDGLNYQTATSPADAYMNNKIYNNRLHNNNCGIGFTDGAVGDMKDVINNVTKGADNYWTGTYNATNFYHIFQYSNYTTTNLPSQYRALNNKIYLRNTLGTMYNPNPIYWKADYNGGPSSGNSFSGATSVVNGYTFGNGNLIPVVYGVEVPCANGLDLDPNNDIVAPTTLMAMMASNGYDADMSIEDALEWWKKYNYYTELKQRPEQIDSPEKSLFVATLDDDAIGKLEEIRWHLNDSLNNDSLSLENKKMENEAIVVNNAMEEKLKQVNNYYIRLLLKKGDAAQCFTADDAKAMRELAQLCPSIYGPAVYAIRTILSNIDTIPQSYSSPCERTRNPNADLNANARHGSTLPMVRDENEPDFTDEEKANIVTFQLDNAEVNLYPNPANDALTIDGNFAENAKISFELFNALGQCVAKDMFENAKPYQINTSHLQNGLYLLKVIENGKIISNNKVSIKH